MKNNKNRHKDRPKSNAEKRKMLFEHGSEIGIVDGKKIGARNCGTTKTRNEKLYDKIGKKGTY